jgi:hypothetical protein
MTMGLATVPDIDTYDDGDLIPPELAVDEAPIPDDDLDRWIEAMVAEAAAIGADPAAHVAATLDRMRGADDDTEAAAFAGTPASVMDFATSELDVEYLEWAMSKVARAQRQLRGDERQAEKYHARIDRWFARRRSAAQTATAFFEGILTAAGRQAHAADDRTKSLVLPSGTISSSGPARGNEQEVIISGHTPDEQRKAEAEVADFLEANLAPRMRADDLVAILEQMEVNRRLTPGDLAAIITDNDSEGEPDVLAEAVKVTRKVLLPGLRKVATVAKGLPIYAETGERVPGTAVRTKERTWKVKPDLGDEGE